MGVKDIGSDEFGHADDKNERNGDIEESGNVL